jgi:4-hydroxybutyrate CoA-transferase
MSKFLSASQAIEKINPSDRIFIHGGAATPLTLIAELVRQAKRFRQAEIIHLHTHGAAEYAKPEYRENFRVCNLFVGANIRPFYDFDRIDYIPCFLSEIGALFKTEQRKPNTALIHVSPPDQHGFCSLGTSVDVAKAAVEASDLVIAQVNPNLPRVFGDGIFHVDQIDYFVETSELLHPSKPPLLTDVELQIGKNVADLIEDGATLQMGIGSIPDAVLASLTNHKDLGIHSEMWSDGALRLIEKGIVNNSKKTFHRGKSTAAFVIGTQRLYDFVNNNPSVLLLEASYVNNPRNIARNPKVCAINSAVEVDLTGQVCADSIGSQIISGVGGQIDFIRGASLSEGGRPVIALPSRTHKGIPRIVPQLKSGAGVVTTRAHVHDVATEFGVAHLSGKTIGERAKALIAISHPDDREALEKTWHDLTRPQHTS